MNKKIFSSMLIVAVVALMAFLVLAVSDDSLQGNSPQDGQNFSGAINLSAVFLKTAANHSIGNVTFMWQLAFNDTSYTTAANNSIMVNFTLQNITSNQTIFGNYSTLTYKGNSSYFNTSSTTFGQYTTLPDGVYNISIYACNTSTDVAGYVCQINESAALVLVDNTAPTVTPIALTNLDSRGQFNLTSGNQTFNVTIGDISIGSTVSVDVPAHVVFSFNNATGTAANYTPDNRSGQWTLSVNISTFHAGAHTVAILVNDSGNNSNKAQSITFTLNTPQNVTWFEHVSTPLNGQNFSKNNGTVYFNISITNGTPSIPLNVTSVIFMFDNASGNGFNVTKTGGAIDTQYYNGSYINISALQEGKHAVRIFVNDTLGNINSTELINFTVDKSVPTVTVSCGTGAVGAVVSCECTASDAYTQVKEVVFVGSTSASQTVDSSVAGSFTTTACSATDIVGNRGEATGTYTITAASSGGSGSGGSGGGSSSSVAGSFEKTTWASILAGETALVPVDNGVIGVTEVSFAVADTTYGAWVQVKKLDSLPSSVGSFARKTYRNVQITEMNVEKAMKDKATIKFKVEKSWLTSQELKKDGVAMFRYADNKWNELPTTIGQDDGTYIHYTAQTPGFSYFVIGERPAEAAPLPVEAPAEGEVIPPGVGGEAPADEGVTVDLGEKGGVAVWLIPLIVVIVIIGLIYYFWQRK